MSKRKVFGIGLHRTGTTSLRRAFYQLGYKTVPPWLWTGRYEQTLKAEQVKLDAFELADSHEAAGYMPFSTCFEDLYDRYPDAKFILTVRNEDKWLKSMFNFFGDANWPEVRFAFGVDVSDETGETLKQKFNEHNSSVRQFFADKPGSLLEMDISKGDGWEELCTFLGEDIPDGNFPRENAQGSIYTALVERAIPTIATLKSHLPFNI